MALWPEEDGYEPYADSRAETPLPPEWLPPLLAGQLFPLCGMLYSEGDSALDPPGKELDRTALAPQKPAAPPPPPGSRPRSAMTLRRTSRLTELLDARVSKRDEMSVRDKLDKVDCSEDLTPLKIFHWQARMPQIFDQLREEIELNAWASTAIRMTRARVVKQCQVSFSLADLQLLACCALLWRDKVKASRQHRRTMAGTEAMSSKAEAERLCCCLRAWGRISKEQRERQDAEERLRKRRRELRHKRVMARARLLVVSVDRGASLEACLLAWRGVAAASKQHQAASEKNLAFARRTAAHLERAFKAEVLAAWRRAFLSGSAASSFAQFTAWQRERTLAAVEKSFRISGRKLKASCIERWHAMAESGRVSRLRKESSMASALRMALGSQSALLAQMVNTWREAIAQRRQDEAAERAAEARQRTMQALEKQFAASSGRLISVIFSAWHSHVESVQAALRKKTENTSIVLRRILKADELLKTECFRSWTDAMVNAKRYNEEERRLLEESNRQRLAEEREAERRKRTILAMEKQLGLQGLSLLAASLAAWHGVARSGVGLRNMKGTNMARTLRMINNEKEALRAQSFSAWAGDVAAARADQAKEQSRRKFMDSMDKALHTTAKALLDGLFKGWRTTTQKARLDRERKKHVMQSTLRRIDSSGQMMLATIILAWHGARDFSHAKMSWFLRGRAAGTP
eukprot:CAMPEP_0180702842 /NCGR_PEP_ID=MMETSP1038_2-20121128/6325_1 /TAXON_ID=632150 /ORGANISM="Azadinium spinosum, Strain 3D9" /LENGTH=691 /DNA_ID=CAMNT_0022734609 /DNA_START=14 /DNA_END=2085 /DNA_ORIENTATION=-